MGIIWYPRHYKSFLGYWKGSTYLWRNPAILCPSMQDCRQNTLHYGLARSFQPFKSAKKHALHWLWLPRPVNPSWPHGGRPYLRSPALWRGRAWNRWRRKPRHNGALIVTDCDTHLGQFSLRISLLCVPLWRRYMTGTSEYIITIHYYTCVYCGYIFDIFEFYIVWEKRKILIINIWYLKKNTENPTCPTLLSLHHFVKSDWWM